MTSSDSPLWAMGASVTYPASKAALNMVTAMYAKELRDTRPRSTPRTPATAPQT
jgi:NAD(P)-dependent dehydrogenase (short-subunit alcohol dehydrogenase family)